MSMSADKLKDLGKGKPGAEKGSQAGKGTVDVKGKSETLGGKGSWPGKPSLVKAATTDIGGLSAQG
eukprot:2307083-Amphidinium_carterae.1